MKKISPATYALLTVLPLFAACASSPRVPMDPNTTVTPISVAPPPVYALLGFRRELELTSLQVMVLDSIGQAVQEKNSLLVREIRARSRERQRQPGFYDIEPGAIPILEELRTNQRIAGEAVAELLEEEQRATVCSLFDRSREERFASRGSMAPRPSRHGEEAEAIQNPAAWSWCASQEALPQAGTS